jgi:hypothetical protein
MKTKPILYLLLAALVIGVGAYLMRQQNAMPQDAEMEQEDVGQEMNSFEEEGNPKAMPGWQVYASSEYGFEMQYPEGWEYIRGRGDEVTPLSLRFSDDPGFIERAGGLLAPGAYPENYLSLVLYVTDENAEAYAERGDRSQIDNRIVAGHPAIIAESRGENYILEAYVEDEGRILIFSVITSGEGGISKAQMLLDEVLERFEFIN